MLIHFEIIMINYIRRYSTIVINDVLTNNQNGDRSNYHFYSVYCIQYICSKCRWGIA